MGHGTGNVPGDRRCHRGARDIEHLAPRARWHTRASEVIVVGILKRLLGQRSDGGDVQAQPSASASPETAVAPPAAPGAPGEPLPACPYCGVLLDPPPTGTRRCVRCRKRIVVRHVSRRAVYLTEAAVPVFEGERQRSLDERQWASERRRWLHLARGVKAPVDRRERIARAPLSADAARAARTLYLTTVEREVRAARRARRWNDVAVLRREQAAVLFEEAGSPVPPPVDVLRLHQEASKAALKAMAGVARDADLVGSTCCPACRADDGKTFRIADELRVPRLPHQGCPRGLCGCDWWMATETPKRRRRRGVKRDDAEAAGAPAESRSMPVIPPDGEVEPPEGADGPKGI